MRDSLRKILVKIYQRKLAQEKASTDAGSATLLRIVDISSRLAGFGNAAQALASELGNTRRGATAAPRGWTRDRGPGV